MKETLPPRSFLRRQPCAHGYQSDAVNTITGLFAGGELSEEDRDEVAKAIQDAYWYAKERNKKYAPFRFRDSN